MNKNSSFFKKILWLLLAWPRSVTEYFPWAGDLAARIIVGYVFMQTGWVKLNNLPQITENFIGLGIPFPHVLTPFVSAVEFIGGSALILGLFTRFFGAMLSGVMVVAIITAKLSDVDSLETLLGFEESAYLAIFFWLAVSGAGKISLDYFLQKKNNI
jgi:putative oxidoreductase